MAQTSMSDLRCRGPLSVSMLVLFVGACLLLVTAAKGADVREAGATLCGQPTPDDGCNRMDFAPHGGDGVINVNELLVVINHWAQNGDTSGIRPPGDCAPLPNGDCKVDANDLIQVIRHWGPCPLGACCLPNEGCMQMKKIDCEQQGGLFAGIISCYNQSECPTAQPNDDCGNASTALGTWYNLHATTDGPAGDPGNSCEELIVRDLWYRQIVNCTGVVEFTAAGAGINKIMAVYDGWSCPPGALLGCVGSTSNASLILDLPVGQQVTIRVGTTAESPAGQCSLSMSCHSIANDDCNAALTSMGFWSNLYATTDGPPGEPGNMCESLMVRDLWYRHTNPCVNFTRYSLSGTSGANRIMAIYDGWTCPPGSLLGCAQGTGLQQITLDLEVGQQVLIRVGTTADSEATTGSLSVGCVSTP